MSTHYLIDLHASILANSRIIGVVPASATPTPTNGKFVIRVPDGVEVGDPTTLSNLLTAKFGGLLSYYAGFSNILYDDFVDETGIDLVNSTGIFVGARGAVSLLGAASTLHTTMTTLFSPPAQALVTYEVYQYLQTDVWSDTFQRWYQEEGASNLGCQVSFNNGATWTTLYDGVVADIALADQGTQMIVKFSGGASRYNLGSWAVLI